MMRQQVPGAPDFCDEDGAPFPFLEYFMPCPPGGNRTHLSKTVHAFKGDFSIVYTLCSYIVNEKMKIADRPEDADCLVCLRNYWKEQNAQEDNQGKI